MEDIFHRLLIINKKKVFVSIMWDKCLNRLESELPEQQFNTWIRPLHAVENSENLRLLAPNRFVLDWVEEHFLKRIREIVLTQNSDLSVSLEIGSIKAPDTPNTDPAHKPINRKL